MMEKSPDAFRTISEVGTDLDLPQHVLRFWETRFTQIRPLKRSGGRRYYRPEDVELLKCIRQLLYGQGYTIKGVQRMLKERGVRVLVAQVLSGQMPETGHGDGGVTSHGETNADSSLEISQDERASGLSPQDLHRLKAALFEMNEGMTLLKDALSSEE